MVLASGRIQPYTLCQHDRWPYFELFVVDYDLFTGSRCWGHHPGSTLSSGLPNARRAPYRGEGREGGINVFYNSQRHIAPLPPPPPPPVQVIGFRSGPVWCPLTLWSTITETILLFFGSECFWTLET